MILALGIIIIIAIISSKLPSPSTQQQLLNQKLEDDWP